MTPPHSGLSDFHKWSCSACTKVWSHTACRESPTCLTNATERGKPRSPQGEKRASPRPQGDTAISSGDPIVAQQPPEILSCWPTPSLPEIPEGTWQSQGSSPRTTSQFLRTLLGLGGTRQERPSASCSRSLGPEWSTGGEREPGVHRSATYSEGLPRPQGRLVMATPTEHGKCFQLTASSETSAVQTEEPVNWVPMTNNLWANNPDSQLLWC